jgi:hypothetical protein
VSLFRKEGWPFIGGRRSTGDVQWRPAHGSGRQGSEEGATLACAAGCGVLHARPGVMGGVKMVWFRGEQGRGPVALPPPFIRVSRPGSGQRGLVLDRGVSTSMATGLGRMGTGSATVASIFPRFRPPSVRSNARKNSKFNFLKSSTLGCQHIKQGFQRYFC